MAEREHLDDRTLVERYEKRIINYVYRITHRYEDAHDLAQEIFVKVYVALDRYDPKYQFSTWLFRIAQNSAIDALRKKTVNEVSIAPKPGDDDKEREFADTGISPYRALNNKQLADAIDTAVRNLPSDYRELIQLRHFAELSYEEIASMKKLPLASSTLKIPRPMPGIWRRAPNAGPSSRRSRRRQTRSLRRFRSMSCRWRRGKVRRIGPGRWFSVLLPSSSVSRWRFV